ncbi:MAG TPA: DUF932 domain-containing protein [Methylosinus sp.]|jgi:hypothetical protein|uniref:DUF932 domain-containing protein n=1 Tax=Methylosinus sp. TaxID=427 RepID=UPI002F949A86
MQAQAITKSQAAAPYKVGNFDKGALRGDVSKQWISRPADQRFLSLGELKDAMAEKRDTSHEYRVDTRKIEFIAPEPKRLEDTHALTVGLPDGTEIAPNHWSFGQLCNLAQAPSSYLRRLPSQIVADALSYGMRYSRDSDEIKAYASGDSLLAATGPDYGRIFDCEVVEAVMQIAGNGIGDMRWKVPGVLDWQTMLYNPDAPVTIDSTTLYASDRDVFIFLVDDRNPIEVGKLPSGDPDLIFRGFYVTNSEVGSGSLRLAAFYLRGVCMNRNLWGVENFQELTMRHSKYAPARFIEESRPALASFANGSTKSLVEAVAAAKSTKLASDQDEALAFLQARSISRKRALLILEQGEREEQRPVRSAWDFAQALTANARSEPNTDSRIEIETVAKKILDKVA